MRTNHYSSRGCDVVISSKFTAGTSLKGSIFFAKPIEDIVACEIIHSSYNCNNVTDINKTLGGLYLIRSNAIGSMLSANPYKLASTTDVSTATEASFISNVIGVGSPSLLGAATGSSNTLMLGHCAHKKLYFMNAEQINGFDWEVTFMQSIVLTNPRSFEFIIRFYTESDLSCNCK